MKKTILISILFLNFIYAKGQSYLALPDSNASWITCYYDGFGWFMEHLQELPHNKLDTIINLKTYTIFPTIGYYRNDSLGRTYLIPQDSTNEYILQDLSKNAGDSVYNVICHLSWPTYIGSYNFYVDSVNYVNVGPYHLKRMYLTNGSSQLYCSSWAQIIWVEKIGCLSGGFLNIEPCYLGGPDGEWLGCMSFNDTTYYENFPNYSINYPYHYGSCSWIVGTKEFNQLESGITLSPNPIEDEGMITLNDRDDLIIEMEIYNSQGQKVKDKLNLKNTKQVLKRNEFNSGIYFAKIRTQKAKQYSLKFIVVQK